MGVGVRVRGRAGGEEGRAEDGRWKRGEEGEEEEEEEGGIKAGDVGRRAQGSGCRLTSR